MREKCITQYELLHRGIDNRTLDTLRKNGNMTLYTLEKICKALDCNPEEVVDLQMMKITVPKGNKNK